MQHLLKHKNNGHKASQRPHTTRPFVL